MTIELHKAVLAPVVTDTFVQQVIKAVQRAVQLPKRWQTLSVVVVGDRTMRQLNQQYRQQNYIPDVLSFPYGTDGGEIVLCYPQAKRQARQKQVPLRQELAWLFIHGLLHVLGYDHETAADAKVMRPLEQRILSYV